MEEVLDPIDYLIDLVLGLELEKDLEKVILTNFHDPKVRLVIELRQIYVFQMWLGKNKSVVMEWIRTSPDAKNVLFCDRMSIKSLVRTIDRHKQHFQ